MDQEQDIPGGAAPEQPVAQPASSPASPKSAEPTAEQQVAELKDRLLRSLAEIENVRRRGEKEREDTAKYAVSNFAREIVSVADNLRLTLQSAPKSAEAEGTLKTLLEGVEMTQRGLHATLEKFGIKVVDPIGQKFDANLHQALFEVPDTGKDAGTVVQVVQQGYQIGDRLLRPAMVGIAKAGAAPPPSGAA